MFQIVAGFGGGFGAWLAFENTGVVDEATIATGRMQLRASAHQLRHGGGLGETVQGFLDDAGLFAVDPPVGGPPTEGANAAGDDRASFADVLRSCALPEQLDWLSEHVSESIPYFYIEELVHTWGCVHFARRVYGYDPTVADAGADAAKAAAAIIEADSRILKERAEMAFATNDGVDVLIRGIWHLLAAGIVAPQAGWSALAALVTSSPRNALAFAKHVGVDTGVVPPPYEPVGMTEVAQPPPPQLEEDGAEAPEAPPPMLVPQYGHRVATIASEAEALACFAAVVDAARRITTRAARSDPDVQAGTQPELFACGPPYDLITPRNGAAFEKRPVAPPLAACISALRHRDRASVAAAMDPLVATMAAVDQALSSEAARHQRRRYGASWVRPWTWHRAVGLGTRAPPATSEAAALGATLPLRCLGSGVGAEPTTGVEVGRSDTEVPRCVPKRDPTLPFRVSERKTLARALELVSSGRGKDGDAGADDADSSVMLADPEGLVRWLEAYAASASANIEQLANQDRKLDDRVVFPAIARRQLEGLAERVSQWMQQTTAL
jgi:hypothetical protein